MAVMVERQVYEPSIDIASVAELRNQIAFPFL